MKCEGQIIILKRPLYVGSAKSGPYLAGQVAVKDGNYDFWCDAFITGDAFRVINGASEGQQFTVAGTLAQNTREKDGQKVRTLQIKVTDAHPLKQQTRDVQKDQFITDDDFPF